MSKDPLDDCFAMQDTDEWLRLIKDMEVEAVSVTVHPGRPGDCELFLPEQVKDQALDLIKELLMEWLEVQREA